MTTWEISGWQPAWMPAREAVAAECERLRRLAGKRTVGAWVAWNEGDDTWFADLPVVLRFDTGEQLEICWQKFDDLSLTWNTIDPAVRPVAWVTWPLVWRAAGRPALLPFLGKPVTGIALTEHRVTTRVVAAVTGRFSAGRSSAWTASGVWLSTDDGGLHAYNTLDENGLSTDQPGCGADVRLQPI